MAVKRFAPSARNEIVLQTSFPYKFWGFALCHNIGSWDDYRSHNGSDAGREKLTILSVFQIHEGYNFLFKTIRSCSITSIAHWWSISVVIYDKFLMRYSKLSTGRKISSSPHLFALTSWFSKIEDVQEWTSGSGKGRGILHPSRKQTIMRPNETLLPIARAF